MGRNKKNKTWGGAISEILVADTASESGAEVILRKEKKRHNNNNSNSKSQQKSP